MLRGLDFRLDRVVVMGGGWYEKRSESCGEKGLGGKARGSCVVIGGAENEGMARLVMVGIEGRLLLLRL